VLPFKPLALGKVAENELIVGGKIGFFAGIVKRGMEDY
jgi:hypothetical protein